MNAPESETVWQNHVGWFYRHPRTQAHMGPFDSRADAEMMRAEASALCSPAELAA